MFSFDLVMSEDEYGDDREGEDQDQGDGQEDDEHLQEEKFGVPQGVKY